MKKNSSWIDIKMQNDIFKKKLQDESDRLSLAEQLVGIRKDAKLTQDALAKKIGTTASAISRYESTDYERYEINTLRKIVAACGGEMHILITKTNVAA